MRTPTVVLFGGTGFIGRHFACHLLAERLADRVYLCDIREPDPRTLPDPLKLALRAESAVYLKIDVRKHISHTGLPDHADLVVNLAAIHREPGHEPFEYYETNLSGAENVCGWSERATCDTIVFTSSIAPYGPAEERKTEKSLPTPVTPYGCSKLVAEKIHIAWQAAAADRRRLLIVRPGVVFGPGEGGHVSLLIRAVLRGFFFYMGNRDTRKAGGYVKELCHSLVWVLQRQLKAARGVELYNFTMDPAPSVEDYVDTICSVAGVKRFVPRAPYALVYGAAAILDAFARPLRIKHPFSPVRVRKLVRSNNIAAGYLASEDYPYRYTLDQALKEWREERPDEWGSS